MTIWFVTRHPGAKDWMHRRGLHVDKIVSHLSSGQPAAGDVVIGILPVQFIAELNRRGVRYIQLAIDLPPEQRGKELSAEQLDALGARLEEFQARRVGPYRP